MGILQTGNTYDTQTFKQGHSRKVWREMRRQWPAGGKVANISDWVATGKIPCGTPCAWSVNATTGAKEVKCFTDAQVKAVVADSNPAGINSLGINGHTDRDIPIASSQTSATATVIRDGDIYEYMLDADVVKALKTNTVNGYDITFVQ